MKQKLCTHLPKDSAEKNPQNWLVHKYDKMKREQAII